MQAILEQENTSDITETSSCGGKYLTFVLCGDRCGRRVILQVG